MKFHEWVIVAIAAWLIWTGLGGGNPLIPVNPPPFPSDGLRVLILEETADRNALPRSQSEILKSSKLKKWLTEHCVKDGWRQLDDDTTAEELKFMSSVWQEAFTQTKAQSDGKTPWIAITDGTRGESRPLPTTEAELMTILDSYGGA